MLIALSAIFTPFETAPDRIDVGLQEGLPIGFAAFDRGGATGAEL